MADHSQKDREEGHVFIERALPRVVEQRHTEVARAHHPSADLDQQPAAHRDDEYRAEQRERQVRKQRPGDAAVDGWQVAIRGHDVGHVVQDQLEAGKVLEGEADAGHRQDLPVIPQVAAPPSICPSAGLRCDRRDDRVLTGAAPVPQPPQGLHRLRCAPLPRQPPRRLGRGEDAEGGQGRRHADQCQAAPIHYGEAVHAAEGQRRRGHVGNEDPRRRAALHSGGPQCAAAGGREVSGIKRRGHAAEAEAEANDGGGHDQRFGRGDHGDAEPAEKVQRGGHGEGSPEP
mmetsp:Transcript_50612/g.145941  ORF Transcript_50612/g.145941 Transcript_50612/m.145941 type:complete len:287 (-) Transcript_50612:524-1384(-)